MAAIIRPWATNGMPSIPAPVIVSTPCIHRHRPALPVPSESPPAIPPPTPSLQTRWAAYRRGPLSEDLIAAVVVTALLVPQSLAYALLAGLPPAVGVMASVLPLLAYAAFGSSSALAVGPVAVLAMMTAQVAGPAAAAHGVAPHLAALVLAAEIAALLLAAALLRLEALAALLSVPVRHGFMIGAALAILISQLRPLVGATAGAPPSAWHGPTAAIGLSTLALLWASRRWGSKGLQALGLAASRARAIVRLAPLAAVAGTLALVVTWPDAVAGVERVGAVGLGGLAGLPWIWQAPTALWLDLAVPAALMALVAYVESLAVAESLGARRRERVSPRRELLGLAAANATAAMAAGMPVTGGFARSVVNVDAGAATRMAGVWTALLFAGTLALAAELLALLPTAVLAATIIVAVGTLVEWHPFAQAWRHSRIEFAILAGVVVLTVVAGIEAALIAGVLASAGHLLQRTARPHWAEVGRLPGTEVFRNVRRFAVLTRPELLAVRIDESLLFTNSRWLAHTLMNQVAARPALRDLVLMMSGVNDIDLSGLDALQALAGELRERGITLHLSEVKGPVRDRLDAAGVERWLGGRIFRTQHEADLALHVGSDTASPR